ncbi:FAD-dependent oxidoreductase [Rubrivivax albus]|uniref:Pyridine nucleotide-disulfide oxidoreductase n=1 Tax=Rubrivivax albus TaxID=2499835 RepID=A0A3S2TQ92_9BURK|nr:FAD/NAD(P)-binding oxidoreductase [Rubrivivax albus]RVT50838.1 pyridine nucleotide-disulfide oxidoreductase [Rubrivivax albus]
MHRRQLLRATGGALLAASLGVGRAATATANGRVVVVGGGMAGNTLARYLKLWGRRRVDVTLVDRAPTYVSNIMSSLVLTGQRSLSSLTYSRSALAALGVNLVVDEVVAVDAAAPSVTLAGGGTLQADRVVLAPGIAFEPPPGYDDNRMPHAWQAGPQTTLLAQHLAALPASGTVVLTIPPTPYRCPPGPYERACLLADWLRANKPGARLLVLDANPDIIVEQDNFSAAFYGLHADVLEYRPGVSIDSVDAAGMTLHTNQGQVTADVVNLIPRQRAGRIVTDAGLATANGGRFAPVDVLSYASTAAPAVHVIGDSSATTQPKAGHIGNQEAKVCADALLRAFGGTAPDPAPVTNSACFSTITMTQASWLTAVFQYDAATRAMAAVPASSAASNGWSRGNFEDMDTWFRALMSDSFG